MKSGSIRAVIFDWAGTAVDFGSVAPVRAFAAAFSDAGLHVSVTEIRRNMGLEKRQHLAQILSERGENVTSQDIEKLYESFNRHLFELLPRYADPIPGLSDVIAQLRTAGVKIGSNTGYSEAMMHVLAPAAKARGFDPDCIVSATDVAAGRPAADMSLRCLELLGVASARAAVKVDDTRAGIEEGRNAGLWTVAVAISGNEVGLPLDEWSALSTSEQTRLRDRAYKNVRAFGADYAIDSVADLGAVLDDIAARVESGERVPAR